MEVAAGNNLVGLAVPSRKYQGVVGYRVGLDQQGARRLPQQIVHGSHHLGLAAQAVRVLHLAIVKYMGAAYLAAGQQIAIQPRSEEHTSELQSLMRISYAVFCLKKKNTALAQATTKDSRKSTYDEPVYLIHLNSSKRA